MNYKEKVIALLNGQELSKEQKEKLENIFPELKNEDEIIRKWLIWYFRQYRIDGMEVVYANSLKVDDILAWIEKQRKKQDKSALEVWKDMRLEVYQQASGNRHEPNYSDDTTKMFSLNDIDEIIEKISEQSHNDKIEPKFHKGAWVVSEVNGSVYQIKNCIENVTNHKYGYDLTNGKYISSREINNYHLWTINDVKSGDVVVSGKTIVLIREKRNKSFDSICAYIGEDDDFIPHTQFNWEARSTWHPATEEQYELLFNKMREAGYKLNNDKKRLKKVNYKK